jgi:hypothetical protein
MNPKPKPRSVLSFPDPVDDISARLVAAGVVVMAAVVVFGGVEWVTLPLAYGFVARVAAGPTLSPLGQLATRVVRPRLPIAARPVPGPPKRFAQAIGAVFTVTAAVLTFGVDRFDLARLVLAGLLAAATLEAVAGICLGCRIFRQLMRVGVIPESVCEACADISSRPSFSGRGG